MWPRNLTHRNRVISFREWLSNAERYLLENENVMTVSANGLGLGEVGELEVQMFKLALMLIEVQMLNLALMPPFCQTPVRRSAFSVH